jgi:hypothetical protein
MVEEKKLEDKKDTLLDVNVSLVLAENQMLKDALDAEKALSGELTTKLKQAMDLIEDDTKSRLIADIKPRTNVPVEILGVMTIEKLTETKKVLDSSKLPIFKSTTPMAESKKKPSLDGMFEDYAKATWRKNA